MTTREQFIEKQEALIDKLQKAIDDIRLGRSQLVDYDEDIIKEAYEEFKISKR